MTLLRGHFSLLLQGKRGGFIKNIKNKKRGGEGDSVKSRREFQPNSSHAYKN